METMQETAERVEYPDRPEGPISAAILAGGIGSLALGLVTTLAEASETIAGWQEFNGGCLQTHALLLLKKGHHSKHP